MIGDTYKRPCHEPQPITKALLSEASDALKKQRLDSWTRIRDLGRNLSQYIHFDYCIASNKYEKRDKYHHYTKITRPALPKIKDAIEGNEWKWLILNDTKKTEVSVVPEIIKLFDKKYPNKSKYEN